MAGTNLKIGRRLTWFLDFVRWASALLVVLFHVRGAVLEHWEDVSSRSPWLYFIYFISTLGHEAVMVFFVLSGFLVGGTVLAAVQAQAFDPRTYAANRISRLYSVLPVALLVGGLIDVVGVHWLHYPPTPAIGANPPIRIEDKLGWGIALGNLLNVQTILVPPLGSNGVLWSLANEFWYYVLFPLGVLTLDRRRNLSARLLTAGLFLIVFAAVSGRIRMYFLVWLLGVAIWWLPRPLIRSSMLGWLLMFASFAVSAMLWRVPAVARHLPPGDAMEFPGDLCVGLAFANLLLTVKHQIEEPGRWMFAPAFNKSLADFSYSLYLFHAPFMVFIVALYQRLVPHSFVRVSAHGVGLAIFAAFIVIIYAYGFALSCVTERHSWRLRRRLQSWLGATKPIEAVTLAPP